MSASAAAAGIPQGLRFEGVDAGSGRRARGFLSALAVLALGSVATPAFAQNVPLGTAASFGVLGGQGVTNTGPTVVTGSVGVYPGSSITGFPPGTIVPGSGVLHSADAVALQAQADLTTAYNDAAGRVCGQNIATDLGGLTLTPGVYCLGAGQLTGILTLNGAGVYIFKFASSLTTAPGSSVVLTNGANACGVWWQVTSSATIDTTSAMAGNVLALTSITLNTGASLNGRALARNALVSLSSNTVTACSGGPAPPVGPPGPGPVSPPATAVPAISAWAMVALLMALLAAASLAIRRHAGQAR